MNETVSEMTRQYWVDTVLGWAERRLDAPQFAECRSALLQAAPASAQTAEQLVERLERECYRAYGDGGSEFSINHAEELCAQALDAAIAAATLRADQASAERDALRALLSDASIVLDATAQGVAVAGPGRTISVTVLLAEIAAALAAPAPGGDTSPTPPPAGRGEGSGA